MNICIILFFIYLNILIKYKICLDIYIVEILMNLGNIGNFLLENYWFRIISYEIILENFFYEVLLLFLNIY